MIPDTEILEELHRRITLTYDGQDISLYTVPPFDIKTDHVVMNPPEYTDDSTKSNYIYECTMLFDVVTFGDKRGSWLKANDIVSQLQEQVVGLHIETSNFKTTIHPYIDSLVNQQSANGQGNVLRKLLRIRFNIQQNGNNI